jgi:2-succinyl-5-enolpyruvyl-6-hydroxy-3-cyclohexene-1-carboxylate synthase
MNPSTAQARVLVDELVRNGVREAVLAPGSRSAPLAFALDRADRAGQVRLHVRVDERSAGFLALGLAKASSRPAVVVTTSGTATANLHPSVLEADSSGVPLVVLTADRPLELRGVGANQTVDQTRLFGAAVRLFRDVGMADERPQRNAEWRALVSRAVAAARGTLTRDPGPVHLNVPLREPLTPDDDGDLPAELDGRAGGRPWTEARPATLPNPEPDDGPARTLMIVGDCASALADVAIAVAQAAGWPVLSEPSGNARRGPNALRLGHLLLDRTDLRPERVLVVGRPTLWRSVQALLRTTAYEVVPAGPRWADAPATARRVHAQVPLPAGTRDPGWLDAWRAADADAVAAAADVLEHWSGPSVASAVHESLPERAQLFVGSSLPVRDLAYAAPRAGVRVLANRGVAGIDGTISTAIGAALAADGPAYALIGDLTFLHDSNGLALGRDPAPDLTIVVVNNGGGGIFSLLEQGQSRYADSFERLFGTPTGTDVGALCAAHGIGHARVATSDELEKQLRDPPSGIRVVEAVVPRPTR